MSKHIVGRHIELTDALKSHIEDGIESLKLYNLDIISSNAIVSINHKHKEGIAIELVLKLKDKNTIVITEKDKDAYTAIDVAVDRAKKALRRHADKIKNHKIMSFKDMGFEAEAVSEFNHDEVEIVPMDLELHKPLDFDEAISALRDEKKRQFIVFNDHEGLMRVMYKRADGKFGLY